MKKKLIGISMLFLLVLMVPDGTVMAQDTETGTIVISQMYETSKWTNVTIAGDTFAMSSDDPFYDKLYGELYFDYWSRFSQLSEDIDLWSLNVDDGDMVISIEQGENEVILGIDPEMKYNGDLGFVIDELIHRYDILTGGHQYLDVWPVDVQVAVLESYPPQYVVSAKLLRGNDMLAVVKEFNTTLIVGLSETFDANWFNETRGLKEIESSIPASGGMFEANFSSVSFGSATDNIDYVDTMFLVTIRSQDYGLLFNSSLYMKGISIDAQTVPTTSAIPLDGTTSELGFHPLFLGLILIPILRRKISEK